MTNKQAYDQLAKELDAREVFFNKLELFYAKNGYIPNQYKTEWRIHEKEKFKPWRDQPKVVKRIKKTARRMSKNVHSKGNN